MARTTWFFAGIVVFTFLAVNTFGSWQHGMDMDDDGSMSNCIFNMGHKTICKMDIFDHLSYWQGLFTALPHMGIGVGLLLMISLVFVAGVSWSYFASYLQRCQTILQRLYLRHSSPKVLCDHILQAFSQGILHPKLY